jgi:hypothetical protein
MFARPLALLFSNLLVSFGVLQVAKGKLRFKCRRSKEIEERHFWS